MCSNMTDMSDNGRVYCVVKTFTVRTEQLGVIFRLLVKKDTELLK